MATASSSGAVFEWEEDLLYALPARQVDKVKCMRAACEKVESASLKFAACSKCGARFCCRECLVEDWKRGVHKGMCAGLGDVLEDGFDRPRRREAALSAVRRVRLYAFPFYARHRSDRGPGALFLQSPNAVEDFYFQAPVNRFGEPLERRVYVAFVTPTEFDEELVKEDFEIALARAAFRRAIDNNDDKHTAPCLLKFRCGYLAVVRLTIVPDLAICMTLAADYQGKDQLQLNIDDHD